MFKFDIQIHVQMEIVNLLEGSGSIDDDEQECFNYVVIDEFHEKFGSAVSIYLLY